MLCAFQRCSQCHNHPVCLILGVFVFIKSFLFCCLWSPKLSPSSQMCCILTWSRCCLCISAQMGMDAATPVTYMDMGAQDHSWYPQYSDIWLSLLKFCIFFPLELICECHLVLSTLVLLILTICSQTSCNEHLTMKPKI